jgi:hypothetical protein
MLRVLLDFRPELGDLLANLFYDRPGLGPIEADPRRSPLDLCCAQQRGQGEGNTVEDAFRHSCLTRAGLALLSPSIWMRIKT